MYQKEKSNEWEENLDNFFALQNTSNSVSNLGGYSSDALAFTPTTLSLLEKTFVDFNAEVAPAINPQAFETNVMWSASNSGDVSDYSDDSSDNTLSSLDWNGPGGKRTKTGNTSEEYRESSSYQLSRKLPGPRPAHTDDELTIEEMQRRIRRRERNKMAAAKCRQRRVDQTNELLIETKSLEDEAQKLEKEIENLQKQKQQLEFVLQAHQPLCCADVKPVFPSKEQHPSQNNASVVPFSASLAMTTSTNQAVRPSSLPISSSSSSVRTISHNLPTSNAQEIFVFDVNSTSATPMTGLSDLIFSSADLMTPGSSCYLLSPSMLLAQ